MDSIKLLTFTLDRQTEAVELKVGYTVVHSEEVGEPMTVQVVWINPEGIKATLTEDEWDVIHSYIFRQEQQHITRGFRVVKTACAMPRSELDPFI